MRKWIVLSAALSLILLFTIIYVLVPKQAGKGGLGAIPLPEPRYGSDVSVEEALLKRRSIREYLNEPITLQELSQLLWAAQGITHDGRRTAPSAGETYPLVIYVVVGNVEGLPQGLYRYTPHEHSIIMLSSADLRDDLYEAALNQPWVRDAAVDLIIAANYSKTTQRYGDRGIRYVHMEAGHSSQNVYLQAVSLGLGTVCVGAFYDERVKSALGIGEDPLYIMPVGRAPPGYYR